METLQNLIAIAIEGTVLLGLFIVVDGLLDVTIECWRGSGKRVQLAVEELTVEEPAIEEPAVEEPAIEEPAVEEPAAQEQATENSVSLKYEAMNVKQLRRECQVHFIDWRKGGDYGKPMRKNQMIRSLTA